ncbi:MAG: carbon-nitrogen hydrolase family protein [Flavitalea sp.]
MTEYPGKSRRNFIKNTMGATLMAGTGSSLLSQSAAAMPLSKVKNKGIGKQLAILQIDSVLGEVNTNLDKIASMINSIEDKEVRMAVFCEYGTSGYSLDLNSVAEEIPGKTVSFLEKLAARKNIWISGGMIEKGENNKPYNTSVMISPKKGLVAKYRKVHVFSFEKDHLRNGDHEAIVETELGKVAMTICYDFIFPEYIRGLALKGAQIILNSTFWFSDDISGPAGWSPDQSKALAMTRALENNVFVGMSCRTGTEKKLWGFGNSVIVGPQGKILAQADRKEQIITAPINLDMRNSWGQYATYMADRRTDIYGRLLGFEK